MTSRAEIEKRQRYLQEVRHVLREALGEEQGERVLGSQVQAVDAKLTEYGDDRRAYLLELANGDLFALLIKAGERIAIYNNKVGITRHYLDFNIWQRDPFRSPEHRLTKKQMEDYIVLKLGQKGLDEII